MRLGKKRVLMAHHTCSELHVERRNSEHPAITWVISGGITLL